MAISVPDCALFLSVAPEGILLIAPELYLAVHLGVGEE
jgi:hypothetical protein